MKSLAFKRLSVLAAVTIMALIAGCSTPGVEISRSLNGIMARADVAPSGPAFVIISFDSDAPSAHTPMNMSIWPTVSGVNLVREGADFRITPGLGFMQMPPEYVSDSRTLFEIPGERSRYVLEYNAVDGDGERKLKATIVERRCQGETCVLALADSLPVGFAEGQIPLATPLDCTSSCPYDAQNFADNAYTIGRRTDAKEYSKYFLVYQAQ